MLLFSKYKMTEVSFSQSGVKKELDGHVGKQPTSLDGGLGSVSEIPMATQSSQVSRKMSRNLKIET